MRLLPVDAVQTTAEPAAMPTTGCPHRRAVAQACYAAASPLRRQIADEFEATALASLGDAYLYACALGLPIEQDLGEAWLEQLDITHQVVLLRLLPSDIRFEDGHALRWLESHIEAMKDAHLLLSQWWSRHERRHEIAPYLPCRH